MWIARSIPSRPCLPSIIPKANRQPKRPFAVAVSVSATSQPRRHRSAPPQNASSSAAEDIGGLGHVVLAALKSNTEQLDPKTPPTKTSNPRPKQQKQPQPEGGGEEGRQLSGSDVLWALQRATARKNKISGGKKKRRSSTSVGTSDKDGIFEEDYSNVRPLSIKSDWATRLDDLERRLQELSDT
ncbi:hypothetical protein L1049_013872 [Liquidambar formosana]|uniref:Uncharacterized protein n=1 Tax=Liquidambar formosana TaxID=63359 RepID=A0AAP0RM64_LIQFO